jgi:dihydrofolate reductase
VGRIKQQEGKDICIMGGGLLAKPLFEADLIDEIGFNIHPVLLGSGIPIFHELNHQVNLELTDCKTFKNGCVLVTYRVKPSIKQTGARDAKSSSGKPAKKQNVKKRKTRAV